MNPKANGHMAGLNFLQRKSVLLQPFRNHPDLIFASHYAQITGL